MLSVIQQYSDRIASWRVLLYEQDGNYARLKLEIVFYDGSKLQVKDYQFAPDERKYARCADRFRFNPYYMDLFRGFRCAQDVTP